MSNATYQAKPKPKQSKDGLARKAKPKPKPIGAATAGPSEDDRFGSGPVAVDLPARILGVSTIGGRVQIKIGRGVDEGARIGMEGYVAGDGGMLCPFQIHHATKDFAYAFVIATESELAGRRELVINPSSMPRPPALQANHRARIIGAHVVGAFTDIVIGAGFTHGVEIGVHGQLLRPDGTSGEGFQIVEYSVRKSTARVRATLDTVQAALYVVLNPSSKADAGMTTVQRRTAASGDFRGEPASVGERESADVQSIAHTGVAGASERLPHFDTIQRAFGKHDIAGVQARVGGPATAAAETLGAQAYATGNQIAFAAPPDLHTAAHEAAHVIQQRRGAVAFKGLGPADDAHERHADAVADAVVAGQSAEPLLDQVGTAKDSGRAADPTADTSVQLKPRKAPKGGKKPADQPAKPTQIDASVAHQHLKEGEDAKQGLETTKALADDLYKLIVARATLATLKEQHKKTYEAAKATRKEMLAKSTFAKVMTAITEMIELGVAIYSVIGAAKKKGTRLQHSSTRTRTTRRRKTCRRYPGSISTKTHASRSGSAASKVLERS